MHVQPNVENIKLSTARNALKNAGNVLKNAAKWQLNNDKWEKWARHIN